MSVHSKYAEDENAIPKEKKKYLPVGYGGSNTEAVPALPLTAGLGRPAACSIYSSKSWGSRRNPASVPNRITPG